jgi:Zn-dependent peptidase ImmA (M78 family)
MKVDFNTNILNDLLGQNPEKTDTLQEKYPKIDLWLQNEDKPTINQLSKIANILNIPFGYFFLKEVPEKKYPIPHYRTISDNPFNPSDELLDTIKTLQNRQQWAKDILLEIRGEELPFANSLTIQTDTNNAALVIKEILKLKDIWADDFHTWSDALRLLIEKTEEAGIFVVVNGVVNNNTKRKLDVEEFRGFVLYDNHAPFIFLNNNDFISGKIFTIIHEIAHILIGQSASFDLRKLQPAANEIELFCDKVAAEFLVPEAQLTNQLQRIGLNYQELARAFKVSQIVIARRLKDLNKISSNDFFSFYDEYLNTEKRVSSKKGGNFYNTAPYRISKNFFQLIYNSVRQNKLLYMDAFRLTGLKPKTFDKYVRKNLA